MTRKTTTIRQAFKSRIEALGVFNAVYAHKVSASYVTDQDSFPSVSISMTDGNSIGTYLSGGEVEEVPVFVAIFYKKSGVEIIEDELDILAEAIEADIKTGDTLSEAVKSVVYETFNYEIDLDNNVGIFIISFRVKYKKV